MTTLKNFFLFCSGADKTILYQCPSDENKYVGIGATIFFTGVLAFFASGYALYTVFDSYLLATIFGLVWGAMIFNLDRYIVSSMKSQGSWWRDFMVATPRLMLAVLLALVISKPLELKIFEKEINAELVVMEQEVFKTQEDRVKVRFVDQVKSLKEEISVLKEEIAAKTKLRDEKNLAAIQEADGTGGSMNKNLGPIYKAKKEEASLAQAELDNIVNSNIPIIAEKEKAIAGLETTVTSEIAGLNRQTYGGMAARMDALSRLGEKSEAILYANIFIMLLFIAIETAPLFVKLISSRGPYDYLLHNHEYVFKMENLEKINLLKNEITNKLQIDLKVGVHKTNAKIQIEKATIDAKLKKRMEDLATSSSNLFSDLDSAL